MRTRDAQFPTRLRELRKARGLSQQALAEAAHVSRSYVSELESGAKSPSVATARVLDQALGAAGELAGLARQPRIGATARLAQQVADHLLSDGFIDLVADKLAERRRGGGRP